ncbi:MAG: ArsR family transcriptional regulator [Gammaproteobacteria bacterium]|nr:ArsR family transcriptional regulator [Gammaproteobacteria bacterium]
MSLAETVRPHQRVSILIALGQTPGAGLNDSILHDAVSALGVLSSRSQIRNELLWLEENGLVRIDRVTPTLMVATLTSRGRDFLAGNVFIDGVKTPSGVNHG